MIDAYVHVLVDPGAVGRAASAIADVDEVSTVHLVTGDYDVVAQLDLDDSAHLPTVVAEEIHDVSGVIETTTNVAFEP